MEKAQFAYVSYIAASPESIWNGLIDPKMTSKYWQHENVSDWQEGSRWVHQGSDTNASIDIIGKVVEFTAPHRMVLTWSFPADETIKDKHSLVTIEIEPFAGVSRLSVLHKDLEPGSDMLTGISEGWPKVLSSLKSLLETGHALPKLW